MANFKMLYVIDKYDAEVYIEGELCGKEEIAAFYKKKYTKYKNSTLTKLDGDIFTYHLNSIKNKVCWEPFKETFRELQKDKHKNKQLSAPGKFRNFMSVLCDKAGKELLSFIPPDDLQVMEDYLSKR